MGRPASPATYITAMSGMVTMVSRSMVGPSRRVDKIASTQNWFAQALRGDFAHAAASRRERVGKIAQALFTPARARQAILRPYSSSKQAQLHRALARRAEMLGGELGLVHIE